MPLHKRSQHIHDRAFERGRDMLAMYAHKYHDLLLHGEEHAQQMAYEEIVFFYGESNARLVQRFVHEVNVH